MTETAPNFDPRYDPRFQRGWVEPEGGSADAAPPVEPRPRVESRPPAERASSPLRAEDVFAELISGPADDGRHRDDRGAELHAPLDHGRHDHVAHGHEQRPDERPAGLRSHEELHGRFASPSAAGLPEVQVAGFAPSAHGVPVEASDLVPPESVRRVAGRWLWLVLGVSLLFVVVGTLTFWQSVTAQNPYTGAISSMDQATMLILSQVAPGAVEIGVIGVVASLVGWAIISRAASSRRAVAAEGREDAAAQRGQDRA